MSDLFELASDVESAADKRYEETIEINDTAYDLVFRQATNEETSAFIGEVGKDTFDEWRSAFKGQEEPDEEKLKRYQKLAQKSQNGRLSDEEQAEMDTLEDETEGAQDVMFMVSSDPDGVRALGNIAKRVVEPDDDDIQHVLSMTPDEQQSKFGDYATDEDGAYELANDRLATLVNKSSDWESVMLGLRGLFIGNTGKNDPNQ